MVTSFWPKQPTELNGTADSTGQGLLVGSVWMRLSRGLGGMDRTAVCANTCNDSPPHPEKLKLIQQYVRITQPGLFWLFWHLQTLNLQSTLPHGPSSSSQAHQESNGVTSGLKASTRMSGSKEIKRTHTPTTLFKYSSLDHKIPVLQAWSLLTQAPPVFCLFVTNMLLLIQLSSSLYIHCYKPAGEQKNLSE